MVLLICTVSGEPVCAGDETLVHCVPFNSNLCKLSAEQRFRFSRSYGQWWYLFSVFSNPVSKGLSSKLRKLLFSGLSSVRLDHRPFA
jgi:hypothetical protein